MPWGVVRKVLDAPLSGMVGKNIEKILGNLDNLMKTQRK
jgi:hypothetical protein